MTDEMKKQIETAKKIVANGKATPIPALISIVAQCRRRDLGL